MTQKVTLSLDARLFTAVSLRAAKERRSFDDIVEHALAYWLGSSSSRGSTGPSPR